MIQYEHRHISSVPPLVTYCVRPEWDLGILRCLIAYLKETVDTDHQALMKTRCHSIRTPYLDLNSKVGQGGWIMRLIQGSGAPQINPQLLRQNGPLQNVQILDDVTDPLSTRFGRYRRPHNHRLPLHRRGGTYRPLRGIATHSRHSKVPIACSGIMPGNTPSAPRYGNQRLVEAISWAHFPCFVYLRLYGKHQGWNTLSVRPACTRRDFTTSHHVTAPPDTELTYEPHIGTSNITQRRGKSRL